MEAAYPAPRRGRHIAAEESERYETMTPEQLMKRATKLDKQMLKHARDLEFEEAARLRDEIQRIREVHLGISDRKAG
jgi:excinuclease ABC subunit B